MNPKFFELSPEKQQRILNAGFRVFSENSYRKSPVREVAEAAGISKSLLFHYFHNKRSFICSCGKRALRSPWRPYRSPAATSPPIFLK